VAVCRIPALDYIKETEVGVKEIIEDKDRRSEIKATLKAMEKRAKQSGKSAQQAFKELQAEMGGHGLNKAAIDGVFDSYLTSLDEYNKDMIELRFQLRDQLSREEWETLFSGQ